MKVRRILVIANQTACSQALLDVVAGFTVTITAARRDIGVDRFIGGG